MATKITSIIFLIVGLAHFSRLVWPFNLVIGNWQVPLWPNALATFLALLLSVWLWRSRD